MNVDQSRGEPPVPSSQGRLESIQISSGGVPKTRVEGAVRVSEKGVEGDRQRDLRYHGGPDRAVCLFSREVIDRLRLQGHPIDAGTTGENFTISGLEWDQVRSGAMMRVGEVLLEIMEPAHPCKNIAGSFIDRNFSPISTKIHRGCGRMYARVVQPGSVAAGDPVTLNP